MPSPPQEAHAGDPRLVPASRATAAPQLMDLAWARLAVKARALFTRRLLGLLRLTDKHAWRRFTEGILDYAEGLPEHPVTRAHVTAYITARGRAFERFYASYPAAARPLLEDAALHIERLVGEVLEELPEAGLVVRDEPTGRHERESEAGRRVESDISDTIAYCAHEPEREERIVVQLPDERDPAGKQPPITQLPFARDPDPPLTKKRPEKRPQPLPAQPGDETPHDAGEAVDEITSPLDPSSPADGEQARLAEGVKARGRRRLILLAALGLLAVLAVGAGVVLKVTNGGAPSGEPNFWVTIGDPYQGGILAYILQAGDPGYVAGEAHGLIAARADQSAGIGWARAANQDTHVGTGTALGTGAANTDKIIAQNGAGSTYAAGLARAYDGGGYSDWYLPSRDELHKLYLNRDAIGALGFESSSYPYYWSSSEAEDYPPNAWAQAFDYQGNQWYGSKNGTGRVRAVRAF